MEGDLLRREILVSLILHELEAQGAPVQFLPPVEAIVLPILAQLTGIGVDISVRQDGVLGLHGSGCKTTALQTAGAGVDYCPKSGQEESHAATYAWLVGEIHVQRRAEVAALSPTSDA
jgi:hypothetical protein